MDYSQYSVGPVNTTIGWTYRNLTCQPAVFTVEVYDDIMSVPDEPVLTLNSTSTTILLPNMDNFTLRFLAYDKTENNCAQDSAFKYYTLDSNGKLYPLASLQILR